MENTEGETFEIDGSQFECRVCENIIEFKFEADEMSEPEAKAEELPEEFEEKISTPENFADEIEDEEFAEGSDEESMKIECECGAEYLIKKVPGVPGFEVTHIVEYEPEIVEQEFEEEMNSGIEM